GVQPRRVRTDRRHRDLQPVPAARLRPKHRRPPCTSWTACARPRSRLTLETRESPRPGRPRTGGGFLVCGVRSPRTERLEVSMIDHSTAEPVGHAFTRVLLERLNLPPQVLHDGDLDVARVHARDRTRAAPMPPGSGMVECPACHGSGLTVSRKTC